MRTTLALVTALVLAAALPTQSAWQNQSTQPTSRNNVAACYDPIGGRGVMFGGYTPGTGVLADTLLWDGSGWTVPAVAVAPPARANHAIAWDEVRRRAVMYGGFASNILGDTWTFDGTTWTQFAGLNPPARERPTMCWDPLRQRVVMFGGSDNFAFLNDTWEWDGSFWSPRTPANAPSPRYGCSMTFDPYRGRIVLFGGLGTGGFLADTWEWDGTDWIPRATSQAPSARAFHGGYFDTVGQRVMVFGGEDFGGARNDWWGLGYWTNAWGGFSANTMPSPRSQFGCYFDASRQRPVLLCGYLPAALSTNEVWEFERGSVNNWVRQLTLADQGVSPSTPVARSGAALTYDLVRDQLVMFGGSTTYPNVLGDTWLRTDARWSAPAPFPVPGPRSNAQLSFDAARGVAVMFGGTNGVTEVNETWEWNGASWTNRGAGLTQARTDFGMCYDGARGVTVLYGGLTGSTVKNETWLWNGTTWTRALPPTSPTTLAGCALAFDAARNEAVLFGGWRNPVDLRNETWVWNGSNWTLRTPANRPARRFGHAMAFDPVRGVVVMFGGYNDVANVNLAETWEWNGSDWTYRGAAANPVGRFGPSLAFDPARNRVVMFGGRDNSNTALGDEWEWNGATWTTPQPTVAPAVRHDHAMVYDEVRGRSVLFGGSDASTQFADTWEYDGVRWHPFAAVSGPAARSAHAMAYDRARSRTLLFGGVRGANTDDETWAWNGTSWTFLAAGGPSPRHNHALAYDRVRDRVVLFGGFDQAGSLLGDTWEWNGSAWSLRASGGPPVRAMHSLVFDEQRNRVVMFGGQGPVYFLADTWEWDGATWTQRTPVTSPSPRWNHAATWDAGRGRMVIRGGYGPVGFRDDFLGDVWEWNGVDWQARSVPTSSPAARENAAIAYDRKRGRCVFFGGYRSIRGFPTWFGDTWEHLQPFDLVAPGHAGGNSLALESWSLPRYGGTLDVRFASPVGLAALFVDFVPRHVPFLSIGTPTACFPASLYTDPTISVAAPGQPARYVASLAIPSLVGSTLLLQGISLTPSNCIQFTDAMVAPIQSP